MGKLFAELKRRNVFRIAALYVVGGWIILQVADVLFGLLEVPDGSLRLVLGILILGFPVALVFSWVYEMTPEGLKRERDVPRDHSITSQTAGKLNAVITVSLVAAVLLLIADRAFERTQQLAPTDRATGAAQQADTPAGKDVAAADKSVAVLPFVDMSPQKDQEYFTDGLTENLLNALAQLRDLKVAGRTSSFAFKNRNEDLRSIGEQLGVAHVLEGSVQKSGERVRITAQLVSAADGYHLWSQTYDRTLEDIFAVQDEIAAEVARAMKVALLGQASIQHQPATGDQAAAYNEYLKGLYQMNRGNMEGNERAIAHFGSALERDPELALAWAGMAKAKAYVTGYADTDFRTGFEEARSYAVRSLELDPDLPEAHLAIASIETAYDWDWVGAEASLQRALALRPGDTEIRLALADLKTVVGKRDEVFSEYELVAQQDPLDMDAQTSLAQALAKRRRYSEATDILDRLIALEPRRPVLHWFRGKMLLDQNLPQQALEAFRQETFHFLSLTGQAVAYSRMGIADQARQTLQSLIVEVGESASYQIAIVYSQMGDADNAVSWLERGFNIRDPGLQYLGVDSLMDPIRDDPRFQALLRKMNLGS